MNNNKFYDLTNEITDFGDGVIKIDIDNKYAKFASYYLKRTGMMIDPKELQAVNEYLTSFFWNLAQIAKIYDDYLEMNAGEIE